MSDIIEKSLAYLKNQSELYGSFSLSNPSESQKLWEHEVESVSADLENTEVTADSQANAAIISSSKDTLAGVTSLEQLKSVCETALELRTDLDGTNLVFGVGNPNADIMLIGEAPGEQEDKKGEPFVGPAGQLLDKIIGAIQLDRSIVYIANILKHRPPNNRDPLPSERERSMPYLLKQIELVNPKLILCLGKVASSTLLNLDPDTTLSSMRGRFHSFSQNIELLVTYHPSALLRNPQYKRPTWEDVQMLQKRYLELKDAN